MFRKGYMDMNHIVSSLAYIHTVPIIFLLSFSLIQPFQIINFEIIIISGVILDYDRRNEIK
jgi:hypothetical protein